MKWILGSSIMAIAMGWAATATIPAATITPDEATLKFLPPETQGIVFIDVAALRSAPLVQDALKTGTTSLSGGQLGEFIAATGFDPRRDVDNVTVGKIGDRGVLAIVQGRIDKFQLEQFFRDKGKEPEAYLGQTLYRDGDGAFVCLNNLVLMGQVDIVKKAIEQMSLPGSLPLRSDLMAAIQTLEAGNQVWAVGDFSPRDLRAAGVRGPAPVVELLKSLQGGTYQMRVDTDIHARGVGTFADAESANNLSQMASGLIAVAKLQVAKQQPDLLHVLDGIKVSSNGSSLTVTIDESGDLLKKLTQYYRPTIEKRNLQ